MASTVLPTYQRYVNGIPVPQSRKTLRLKEKYVLLLVFVSFGTVCFGAFFFLPDLRDRVSVDHFRRQLGDEIFMPQAQGGGGKILRHNPDEEDNHLVQDKDRLQAKIESDLKGIQMDGIEKARSRLNMSHEEHDKLQKEILDEKQKLLDKQRAENEERELKAKEEALKEKKDHEGVNLGGPPVSDEETKRRQQTVKEVHIIYM